MIIVIGMKKGESLKENDKFNYCIARYWNGVDGALCVYAYGSEVHYGTQEEADALLEYVNKQNENDYEIRRVG